MRTALLLLLAAGPAHAGEMVAEIRTDKVDYFLSAAFARYGHDAVKAAAPDKAGVRLRLARPPKDKSNAGMYGHFTLGGDCEFLADYELVSLPKPSTGYGAQIGLALHTHGPGGAVFVSRGATPDSGGCWSAVHETPNADRTGKDYATDTFPAAAPRGRMGVRREGTEAVVLASEKGAPLKELKRFPLGADPVYQVRVFADTGGADVALDGRLYNFVIRAESITGAPAPPAAGWAWTTWLLVGSAAVAAPAGWLAVRRRRRDRDA